VDLAAGPGASIAAAGATVIEYGTRDVAGADVRHPAFGFATRGGTPWARVRISAARRKDGFQLAGRTGVSGESFGISAGARLGAAPVGA